jgi:hypothetical protein
VGRLIYGATVYQLDDRLLAHLQMIVAAKLRRHENFFVSWRSPSSSKGRQSVWIDNGMHLAFEYDDTELPTVNRDWVETMATSAATAFGLQLTDELGELLNAPPVGHRGD